MKQFTRTIEDFVCENCGYSVKGTGYTNHCPKCVFSKHGDINPGDRQAQCGGMMEPTGVEQKHGDYIIIHKCTKCGHVKKNKVAPADNKEKIIELTQQP